MGARDTMMGMLDSLLAFGRVTATKQATETKQVLASVAGNSGTTSEERPFQALWGHAAILFRPPVDTEVIFARVGDEMVPIASREVRWAIDVEEGEVVVRNLVSSSAQQARIRLKANGECIIDSPKVYIGDGGASEAIGLGTAIKNHLSSLKSWADGHTHILTIAAQAGAGGTGTAAPPASPSPTVPDVESRHVVEN